MFLCVAFAGRQKQLYYCEWWADKENVHLFNKISFKSKGKWLISYKLVKILKWMFHTCHRNIQWWYVENGYFPRSTIFWFIVKNDWCNLMGQTIVVCSDLQAVHCSLFTKNENIKFKKGYIKCSNNARIEPIILNGPVLLWYQVGFH